MSAERLHEALESIKSGNYDVALSNCREVIERHPDDADVLHLAGYVHQVKGEHEEALRYFAQAGLRAPDNAEIHNNHAGSLKALGRFEQSERYYRRAIALEAGFALAHHNYADLLLKLDRPAEATARCRAALELEPALAQTCITLGVSLEQQGRYEECLRCRNGATVREAKQCRGIHRCGFSGRRSPATGSRCSIAFAPRWAERHGAPARPPRRRT